MTGSFLSKHECCVFNCSLTTLVLFLSNTSTRILIGISGLALYLTLLYISLGQLSSLRVLLAGLSTRILIVMDLLDQVLKVGSRF